MLRISSVTILFAVAMIFMSRPASPDNTQELAAGWGKPRTTRLTRDEQRTQLTLWSIFRSPLIIGGNLTLFDEWTESLLTNPEVIAVDQH